MKAAQLIDATAEEIEDLINRDLLDDDGMLDALPKYREVCHRCSGKGSHVNPAIDGHGISAQEWNDEWTEEDRENYHSGVYDIPCHECSGKRVVWAIDRRVAETACPALLAAFDAWQESIAESDAIYAAERSIGA